METNKRSKETDFSNNISALKLTEIILRQDLESSEKRVEALEEEIDRMKESNKLSHDYMSITANYLSEIQIKNSWNEVYKKNNINIEF